MNNETTQLVSTLEALFTSQIKIAQHHGLDTLPHISVARARDILNQLRLVKARCKRPKAEPDPAYFAHLDKIHA
jgi:hypothetical protein